MFETPDRHTPPRSPIRQANCTFRTSRSPNELSSRERHARQRDHSRDPFHTCVDSGQRTKIKHQVTANGNGTLAPHHTPSFIDVHDTVFGGRANNRPQDVRHVSQGSIWSVGGRAAAIPQALEGVDTGTGEVLASGTNAPLISAHFLEADTEDRRTRRHETRLALALDIDQASRVLPLSPPMSPTVQSSSTEQDSFDWKNGRWAQKDSSPCMLIDVGDHTQADAPIARSRTRKQSQGAAGKAVPSVAFRVLDAPRLKDDFYCSVLAYYYPSRTLAVALTHRVYLWTELHGVRYPPLPPARIANYVSSLAFSSSSGGKGVLAIARNSGHITLWSLFEQKARFEAPHPWAICSVAFRPTPAYRQVASNEGPVQCEDLLVGDDSGCLYYYSLHWPEFAAGSMTLLTKLDAHSQNICGLAWSPDGETFVSGGNDNAALLFAVNDILDGCEHTEDMCEEEKDYPGVVLATRTTHAMLTPPASPLRERMSQIDSNGAARYGGTEQAELTNPVAHTLGIMTPITDDEIEERQGRSRARLP